MRLCLLKELPDGDARGFDPENCGLDTVFIVRQGEVLYGWRNACPHIEGAPLPWRRHAYLNFAKDRIVCSAHGALFEIATGLCVLGPCLGQSLTRIGVVVDEGAVYLFRSPESSASSKI